jgi:23S rRNA pseudouridine1911/1915/1917 synthase
VKQRVPDAAAGERLDRYLASLPEIGSRGTAERALEAGVLVDGTARAKSHRLSGGEELEFDAPERPAPELAPEQMDLRIAYEDEHLVVVDKPAGLVVHPAPGHATGTLVHGLLAHDVAGGDEDRPGIVHRLDRDTSGLMVVARSEHAYERLQQMVRDRELERHYRALVVGRPRSRGSAHPFTGEPVDVESPLPEDLQIAARMAAAS